MSETRPFRSVAVLGAGTMGAQIAAHFANVDIPALLLDLTPDLARQGLERARKLTPDPFFTSAAAALVTTGGFDRELARLGNADWIIEAVLERADAKQALLERVDGVRRPGTIVSSNTSGIPIGGLAGGRSDDFRRHWLGTHFFNPPRYMRLLEVVPTPETLTEVVARVARFADVRLGKGVVIAKDTPNFIANHLGLFGLLQTLRGLDSGRWTIEEIDAVTGPVLGRPTSATFRTMDLVGIDILDHVARNLYERLTDEDARRLFAPPPIIERLLGRGWMGDKAGQGFYKRQKGPTGTSEILVLDPATLSYRPKRPVHLPSLDAARAVDDVQARIKLLFLGQDTVGVLLRETLGALLLYAAHVTPSIANTIDDVDRAMRWGFGWELGPFELWDAIGLREVLQAVGCAGSVPPLVEEALAHGRNRFRDDGVPPAGPGLLILKSAKDRGRVLQHNAGASLVDLDDGVLAVEFHSKMNAIGGDGIEMLRAGVTRAAADFTALVVGNEAPNFSAGANLLLLLIEAQEGNWDEIDSMVRAFQQATGALRYADVPVIVSPAGLALGGGCEIVLHGDRVQAAAESYLGLVEVGVGLIPAGGGTTEMLARSLERLPSPEVDVLPFVKCVFETIGTGRVSTSAADAQRLGYLRDADAVTMNRERLLADAKALALECVRQGYRPPRPRHDIPVGGDGVRAALDLGVHLLWRAGRLSDHDALIGRSLARILSGGSLPHRTTVSEQYLLDLERETFLKLCGEPLTRERIQYTLKTGKMLRN